MDEAIYAFGIAIENDLESMKQHRSEKAEAFGRRKHNRFLALLDATEERKFASPMATK